MTKISDIKTQPVSGLLHIDALLDSGPQWNFMTPGTNTLTYTFSVSAGNEVFKAGEPVPYNGAVQAFSAGQQQGARTALEYISELTGIKFVESSSGTAADFHFANANLVDSKYTGLCSWKGQIAGYPDTDEVTSYVPDAYVYMDNAEFAGQNANLAVGTAGYQTLLHELGHALGLKHPFEKGVVLPDSEDTTSNTLMSYDGSGGPYSGFRPYDIAALNYLFGGDGLGGAIGGGSASGAVFLTGTDRAESLTGSSANDILQGNGGNDVLNGAAGIDTARYAGARANVKVLAQDKGSFSVAGTLAGSDVLTNVERLHFDDIAVGLDIDGSGGEAYRLYRAAFDRAPDLEGLGFWIDARDKGVSLTTIADGFIHSDEFKTKFGANPSNEAFLSNLYKHVMHRAADGDGYLFFLNHLNAGNVDQAGVLAAFSESPENYTQVIGSIQNGFDYVAYHG